MARQARRSHSRLQPAPRSERLPIHKPFAPFTRLPLRLQGMIQDDNPAGGYLAKWVVCDLNSAYELSATYPSKFFTPRVVNAETIKGSAAFRSKGRLPALTWYANREDGIRSIVRYVLTISHIVGASVIYRLAFLF